MVCVVYTLLMIVIIRWRVEENRLKNPLDGFIHLSFEYSRNQMHWFKFAYWDLFLPLYPKPFMLPEVLAIFFRCMFHASRLQQCRSHDMGQDWLGFHGALIEVVEAMNAIRWIHEGPQRQNGGIFAIKLNEILLQFRLVKTTDYRSIGFHCKTNYWASNGLRFEYTRIIMHYKIWMSRWRVNSGWRLVFLL